MANMAVGGRPPGAQVEVTGEVNSEKVSSLEKDTNRLVNDHTIPQHSMGCWRGTIFLRFLKRSLILRHGQTLNII